MALALIGYFCTMVSALAVFMVVLRGLISPIEVRQPHPVVQAAQTAVQEKKVEEASAPARAPFKAAANREKLDAALRSKQRMARYLQKRKVLAHKGEERGNPTALAYGQEILDERELYGRMTSPFAAPRF